MVKYKSKTLFKLILTLCFIFSCFCWAGEQKTQYDNLSFGDPGKADIIIDRPGYALSYIEYHEQPAWVIYIMTKTEFGGKFHGAAHSAGLFTGNKCTSGTYVETPNDGSEEFCILNPDKPVEINYSDPACPKFELSESAEKERRKATEGL